MLKTVILCHILLIYTLCLTRLATSVDIICFLPIVNHGQIHVHNSHGHNILRHLVLRKVFLATSEMELGY